MASDDFNRADAATLGANWAVMSGIASCKIITNQASETSGVANGNYWTADAFGSDQYSQVGIAAAPNLGNFTWAMVHVRYQGPGISGYSAGFDSANFGDNLYRIEKWTNYAQSTLAVHASQVAVNGDVIKLRAVGTTLTLTVNGIDILSVVDATYAGGIPGISIVATLGAVDNWSGNTIVPGNLLLQRDMSGIDGRYLSSPI